jgi:polyisoprenoid-binding protein YceI
VDPLPLTWTSRGTRLPRSSPLVALVFALAAPLAHPAAADAWSVVRGAVRVECPLTIGGSFEAKTAAIRGTVTLAPAAVVFEGDLSVALGTLDTGIDLRNEHLRRKYLEVDLGPGFDRAVLSGISLGGRDPRQAQGRTPFTGTLLLHGVRRPVAGQATVHPDGNAVRVEARFPVSVSAFGIQKPQYLGVGLKDQVMVTVSLVAQPSDGTEGTR